MSESEMECFSGVKTAQNSKGESGIEKKKLKEYVSGAILPREKPEECVVKKLQRLILCRGAKTTGKNVLSLVFYKMPD